MPRAENSAVDYAKSLGVRSNWSKYAVWAENGLDHEMRSFPSMQLGDCRNDLVSIRTPGVLFIDRESGNAVDIPLEDLELLERLAKFPLDDQAEPYQSMAFTKIEMELAGTQISTAVFLNNPAFIAGNHTDIRAAVMKGQFDLFAIPKDGRRPTDERRLTKYFFLDPLIKVWRHGMLACKHKDGFGPNDENPNFYSGLGSPDNLTHILCGQWRATNARFKRNWLAIIPIELFEQLYASHLKNMVGAVFLNHIKDAGLRIRANP